ncbi:MAG: tRNA (adenosine(37)-N6)-dimethylallyltransferase MiaA [Bacteroidales bacterium]|nr:tRNA (adenosine(37)-N6)-dimethylallyltransferase MiaA [Bacteroidales bacterium]MCF8389438.1 tRNA (adenosine(37)-N6)-dimethylallyltransferase MiaA [Bacteroidales bacterium]
MKKLNLITILGPTAGGKTGLAAHLALEIDGEILSADSRQVYRKMDIGTGKDLSEYSINGRYVPYHLIDIVDPGYEYNVFEFQKDFIHAFKDIRKRNKLPILCGGSGMYIEAVLDAYKLIRVPVNKDLRENLESKSMDDLRKILFSYKTPHNQTDTESLKRILRAIEIAEFYKNEGEPEVETPDLNYIILGVKNDRETQRKKITERLDYRLKNGMIEEVKDLLESGVDPEKLIFYGLEYKYITWYITGKIDYETMFQNLNTAIHQFGKRQMTWFRKMERHGFKIHWIDGLASMEKKLARAKSIIYSCESS